MERCSYSLSEEDSPPALDSQPTPIGRIVGPEAMTFGDWQRLNAEYAKQFGVEIQGSPPNAPKPA